MEKTRIAILGGGPAALAAAFELTNSPGLRGRYDIDLYQIGWRLGGKCASVRNRAARCRNEEHGLHILGGFYHNVFSQLRPLYAEWAEVAPATAIPFADAFIPHDTFTLMQRQRDSWRAVSVEMPPNDQLPGVNPPSVTPAEMLERIVSWLGQALQRLAKGEAADLWMRSVQGWNAPSEATHLTTLAERGEALLAGFGGPVRGALGDLAARLADHAANVQGAVQALGENAPPKGPDWLGVVELIATIARGFAADRLDVRGFDSINDLDAAAWLRKHGGSNRAVTCPLFEAGYHYSFAFENGDWTRPNIAAGVGMRGLLRMVFAYHGSVFMHMNGGMGEIIATPYFEVLQARGVRFHFFNRVEALIPGDDGRLAEIRYRVQAQTAGGPTAYQPLFDYDPGNGARHRRCWPEAPLYEQLTDAEEARRAGDLEKWIDSDGVGVEASIRVDRDFDLCILGMSMGALRETTDALGQVNPAWRAMLDSAGLIPTIAGQIWRRESAASFHGVSGDGLMTGYVAPDDTWGDMSFLTAFEQPDAAGDRPASLSYLCGPITPSSGPGRASRPARETELWLQHNAAHIFPGLDDGHGGYRLDGEMERYSRINDDPIDLYVRSPSGSIDKRLRPDESGFPNLMLVGDWTRNNFDCGAVETAVLSAKLCSRAISGSPSFIYGESDFA
jgi:uncharacterized protein with NAD-binding domain and iron-sulfur cluster